MTEFMNELINATFNACLILVPILGGALYCKCREVRELRRRREEELSRIERQLELEVYALEFYHAQIDDMIKNGSNGKLLKHLIETGQL